MKHFVLLDSPSVSKLIYQYDNSTELVACTQANVKCSLGSHYSISIA